MTKKGFIFLLVLIGLLVFFNSLFNGFLWDDEEQVLNNVLAHSITNFPKFFLGSTFNSGGGEIFDGLYYKPLMTTFFSLIYTFFGANPFFFHFFQVSLHIVNTILVFLVFRHIFTNKKDILPFILALIFLVHPINAEAVVYISSLQEPLFFFFGICSLWIISSSQRDSIRKYLIISVLLLCSLLSKETGILFIFIVLLYSFFFLKKRFVSYVIVAISSVALYSFLRFVIAGIFFNKHNLTPISIMPIAERLMSVPKIIIFYFKTAFYPVDLSINQHWVVKSMNIPDFFIPLFICLIILSLFGIIGLVLYIKKSPDFKRYLFFLIWFTAGLILHLNAIFPLDMTVAERWFYFPIIGLLGMYGTIFTQIKLNNLFKTFFTVALIVLILLFSIRTLVRNSNWKDGLTLYSHDILISTNTFDLENNFGVELFRAGRFDEAEQHFKASTILAPNWWTNWNNLGVIEERKNNLKDAENDYQKAIDNGRYYLAYQNLAKIYLFSYNDPSRAALFCEKSLLVLPNNATLWQVLAISEYKLNKKDEALVAAKNAYYLEQSQQNVYIYSRINQNLPLEGL